ncbi:MAG: response regulator [Alphaproteobacteria bacterium]
MSDRYDYSGLAVLIVDSNPFWTRLLNSILGCMRIESTRNCASAIEAWKELQTWTPDVIFVDLAGEEIDSLRFIRGIRRRDNPARCCPIILTSNVAGAAIVKRARNAGADYTVAKPFSVQVIYRALAALRDSERAFVEASRYYGPDRRRRTRSFIGDDRRAENPPAASDTTSAAVRAVG